VKHPGDEVLSGAIVVAGSGRFQATAVGDDAYARKIAKEARRFSVTQSELVDGINVILKFVTWILLIVGPLVFWRQLDDQSVSEAITGAVGTVVLMVPEGLVLLTSISFGLAALTLARRRVLVQELPAVEGLARVDVVCLDKTGTLTEGIIEFDRLEALDPSVDGAVVAAALGAISHDEGGNATQDAIAAAFPVPTGWRRDGVVPFSSGRKWSASSYGSNGAWVLGAPEMVIVDASSAARRQADELAAEGNRVLLLAKAGSLQGETLPADLHPVSLVLLEERVRPDAEQTLAYFAEQGVHLKVISGDNPRTVGAVARRVGLPDPGEPFDARELPEDTDELAEVLEQHSVFGRVTPHQKRAMVKALQSHEHVVAMTGDGVNDALALKDADIGVAMGSGAAATRAVAQLVLLDSEFDRLPGVVAEGRRVIANIERVSNLFLTKTTYASLLAVVTVIVGWAAYFLPRQSTIINGLTIGIPAFFLALAPNTQRYVPGFIKRVLRFSIPAGVICAAAVVVAYALAHAEDVGLRESRTTATIVLMILGLYVLAILARPYTAYRLGLLLAMIALFVGALLIPFFSDFFKLDVPGTDILVPGLVCAAVGCVGLELVTRAEKRWSAAHPSTREPDEARDATASPAA
jgi:cation-transporting ATPase E